MDPSRLLRAFFERLRRGDTDAALELLAEDCVIEVPPSMSAEPDVYEGHEGARRYMQGFEGLVEDLRFEPLEFLEEDGRMIVLMRVSGRGATSGIEIGLDAAVLYRVEGGRIKRMDPFPDLDSARKALRDQR